MKIVSEIVIFTCIVNLIRSQSEVDSETKVPGDSEWWSTKITKINMKGRQQIGLASEDNQRRGEEEGGDEAAAIRDSGRRPSPFASVVPSNPETRFQDRFGAWRDEYRREEDSSEDLVINVPPEPSPILLPPFYSSSSSSSFSSSLPAERINIFAKNAAITPEWKNESSSNGGKSATTSSALERIRIYEITTLNSTNDEAVESEASHANDNESLKSFRVNDVKNHWTNHALPSYDNGTKHRNGELSEDRRDAKRIIHSFYIDEKERNERRTRFKGVTDRNNLVKTFRGNRRYQDGFGDEEAFTRKRTFLGSAKYESPRRHGERSNRLKFNDDTDAEGGSVPGVPGRDYPIHQEHTHHHLRNVIDRFPCPRAPKTHIYLPDRASRCQIFYVCYGSATGVPMVCPNGTLFNESLQVCDWWYNVSC